MTRGFRIPATGSKRRRAFDWQFPRLMLVVLVAAAGTLVSAQDVNNLSHGEPIKVDVGLVNLNVTVTERGGQPYTALKAENFQVYDNGVEQVIHHFSRDDVPFSMGLILDRSGSMSMMMNEVYQAAFHSVEASKPEDEFFIESFNEGIRLDQDFSTDRLMLERRLRQIAAGGLTALYDAILEGFDHIQKARHEKKALLVVTDGADNSSRHRFEELLELAREQNVALCIVGMFDPLQLAFEGTSENPLKQSLTQLAEATGGRAYFPRTVKECEQACIAIAHELRQQYSLGYYLSPELRDGNWHKAEVRLNLDKNTSDLKLLVRTRPGYYAPRRSEP